ncbi:MAG: ABC transporter permease [Spirochaetes bacterium]|nr:ABC transporter permease [Spirochaetota bacterium]
MRASFLASRDAKEILRDPLSVLLGISFPLILMVLFSILAKSAPLEVFRIQNIAPGMLVFGFSFLTLFSALLIAKDKSSSFLLRLFASPLKASDYILSYAFAAVPFALIQCVACFLLAFVLGLSISRNALLAALVLLPQAAMSIFAGILFGTLLNEGQVTGVGTLYINLGAWFSGAWMDLNMIGGIFKRVGYALPFAHSIDAARAVLSGQLESIPRHLAWGCGYALLTFILAIFAFRKKMRS